MAVTTNITTADELLLMPRGNVRRELIRGALKEMAPSGFEHGAVTFAVGRHIANFVHEKKLGLTVGGESGFFPERHPDTVRGADIAFVRADRIPASGPTKKFFDGAPDLAVEVVLPSDTMVEVEEKVADYLKAGTRRGVGGASCPPDHHGSPSEIESDRSPRI